ncbi:hypothetical protein [Amnibacterium kyonggiense]|uniref:Uncharacterized protein n=1 Tax=Amnibacterium kyonggiense TaxID=595671 RepID=A0A4V3EAM6_9MICO|nr:hypothetical protein [Amnibacterium kyonggiense]TDS76874.1 hypothetical protein CLV52_1813 [Amnibacterium kyonggiense]
MRATSTHESGADRRTSEGARRAFALLAGAAALVVLVQFATGAEVVGTDGAAADRWAALHGATAFGLVAASLAAAVVAVVALRRAAPVLAAVAVAFAAAALVQTATGRLISDADLDALVPLHVFCSALVVALAAWASIGSAALRRSRSTAARP